MITTEDRFNRLLESEKDEYNVSRLKTERAERSDLLDKFAGTEGFEEQIAMLKDEIARIDAALSSNATSHRCAACGASGGLPGCASNGDTESE